MLSQTTAYGFGVAQSSGGLNGVPNSRLGFLRSVSSVMYNYPHNTNQILSIFKQPKVVFKVHK